MSGADRRVGPKRPRTAFPRALDVASVPETGLSETIEADEAERRSVAEEIGLPAIGALMATYRINRQAAGQFLVEGAVKARITQICTVSLEPFESEIEQPIEVTFVSDTPSAPSPLGHRAARDKHRRAPPREAVLVPSAVGEKDPPDPIVDGRIDLGALAVEFLVLALDFYPRKPGVHFTDVVLGETGEVGPSAFAALERFKDRS